MTKTSRRRLAITVVGLLRERPADTKHILDMLAAYLIAHKQDKQWELLMLDIARELAQNAGHLYAEVTTPYSLDTSAKAELERFLQSKTGAKSIELDEQIDPELLAGLVVRTAEQELDTSARTKLKKLSSLHITTPQEA